MRNDGLATEASLILIGASIIVVGVWYLWGLGVAAITLGALLIGLAFASAFAKR